jgi:membrane protein DedA with SNARE-associated domain
MNRIPIVMTLWFALWTTLGYLFGRVLETPGIYTSAGFILALPSIFSWPFIFPERLLDWMER